jgi:hypothetical protein
MQWLRNFLFPDLAKREQIAEEKLYAGSKALDIAANRMPRLISAKVFLDNDMLYLGRLADIFDDEVFQYFLVQLREVHILELEKLGRSNNVAVINNLVGRLQQIEEIRFALKTRKDEHLAACAAMKERNV